MSPPDIGPPTVQNPLPSRAPKLVLALVAVLAIVLGTASAAGAQERSIQARPASSWGFSSLGIPSDRPGGQGVTVAIVDSGIDPGHPAFSGRIAASIDCVGSGGDPANCSGRGLDENGHGTHIAGIVAARSVNGGPEGIAPDARILAIRSLSNTCSGKGDERECRALGELGDVVAGVRVATERRADIINLSIDAGVDLDWQNGDLADAISDAWAAGAVVVASTGNRSDTIDDPALAKVPLLLVGAITADGLMADYSNLPGTARWALMAPGGEAGGACPTDGVLSTYPRTVEAAGTGCLSGTSMSAAFVSGALASLVSTGLEPQEALAHMLATAVPSADLASPVPDLGQALATEPGPMPAELTAGLDVNQRRSSDAGTGEVSSAAGIPIGEWTRVHPIRARAVVSVLIAGLAMLAVLRRMRERTFAFGF